MGQYVVVDHETNKEITEIVSPGAQTWGVVILRSDAATAVAHIDNAFHAASTVNTLVEKLTKIDSSAEIKATIVGGDFGIPYLGNESGAIFRPIYDALKKHNIEYKHDDYSYALPTLPLLASSYFLLSTLGIIGPSSTVLRIALLMPALIIAEKAFGAYLETTSFSGNNYNVSVKPSSGEITIKKAKLSESISLLEAGGVDREVLRRGTLNPKDPRNKDELELIAYQLQCR